jgi:hypothetical protein
VADVRYTVPGVPPGPAAGLSAFTPAFVRHAASSAQSYKYAAEGYPGTRGIPMEARKNSQRDPGGLTPLAAMGGARSTDAPDAIWPNQYYQWYAAEYPGAGQRIQYYDPVRPGLTSVLPVPAEDYRAGYQRDSAKLARLAVLRRVKAMPWFPRSYNPSDTGTRSGR